jgi:hypothetical protein
MATTKPKAKEAKPLSATERKAEVARAEAEMTKHRPAFQAYRNADAKVRKAKKNGKAPEAGTKTPRTRTARGTTPSWPPTRCASGCWLPNARVRQQGVDSARRAHGAPRWSHHRRRGACLLRHHQAAALPDR